MSEATLIRRIEVRPVLRFVRIVCPECGRVQGAAVEYLAGCLPVYVHVCIGCGYLITESEWDEVEDAD